MSVASAWGVGKGGDLAQMAFCRRQPVNGPRKPSWIIATYQTSQSPTQCDRRCQVMQTHVRSRTVHVQRQRTWVWIRPPKDRYYDGQGALLAWWMALVPGKFGRVWLRWKADGRNATGYRPESNRGLGWILQIVAKCSLRTFFHRSKKVAKRESRLVCLEAGSLSELFADALPGVVVTNSEPRHRRRSR